MRIRVLMLAVMLGSLASGLVALLAPQEAEAIPAFVGKPENRVRRAIRRFPN